MKTILDKMHKNSDIKKNQKIQLELHFKKIFSIIFQYHKNDKTIIFLDSPYKFKNKQHLFLSTLHWLPGLLTNKQHVYKNNDLYEKYSFLTKKPDLFVIFQDKLNDNLLKEILKLKIPIFMFGHPTFNKIKYNRFILFIFRNIFKK